MVIEDLEHVLAPRKFLRIRRTVSPLGALNIWGETRPLKLKSPQLRNPLSKSIQILTVNASWNEV